VSFVERWLSSRVELPHVCLGVDPSVELLRTWGLPATAEGAYRFGLRCVEAADGLVACIKPQIAFFEQFGSAGIAALEKVLAAARGSGLLILMDGKRNDIGSTVDAYARAYFHEGAPLNADALTASPYLGLDALSPLLHTAADRGRTLFVLVRTSNAEQSRAVQSARNDEGLTLSQALAGEIARWNDKFPVPGTVGAVVGATVGGELRDLIERLNGSPVLAPGVGAQGGGMAAVRAEFPPGYPVLFPLARSVLGAGPDGGALRGALRATRAQGPGT
jgi:orotidine-5'-phosphate decarboxylase